MSWAYVYGTGLPSWIIFGRHLRRESRRVTGPRVTYVALSVLGRSAPIADGVSCAPGAYGGALG